MFAIVLGVLFGSFVVFRKLSRLPIEVAPFFVVSLLVSLLYLAAISGVLRSVVYFVYLLGFGAFAWMLFLFFREPRKIVSDYLTPGIIQFFLALVFLWFKVRGASFSSLDEFAYWGVVTKSIFLTNGITQHADLLNLAKYPPGSSLFHYFVYQMLGFSEGVAYFAHDILLLAPLLLLFQFVKWSRWWIAVILGIGAYLLVFVFGHWSYNIITGGQGAFLSINPDLLTGIFAGALLASFYLFRERDALVFYAIPVLFCLPMLKGFGALFAYLFVVAMFFEQLMHLKSHQQAKINLLTILVLYPMVIHFGGHLHVYLHDVQAAKRFDFGGLTKDFFAGNWHQLNVFYHQHRHFIDRFWNAVLHEQVGRSLVHNRAGDFYYLAIPQWLGIIGLLSLSAIMMQKRRELQYRIVMIDGLFLVGLLGYLLSLMLFYLSTYSALEVGYLSSFPRYMGRYFIAWLMVLLAFFLGNESLRVSEWVRVIVLSGIVLFLFFVSPDMSVLFLKNSFTHLTPIRGQAMSTVQVVKRLVPADKKLYIMWQGVKTPEQLVNVSLAHKILRYEVFPMQVNDLCWNFSQRKETDDARYFSCYLSAGELKQRLKGYDYLLVSYPEKFFLKKYQSILGVGATAKRVPAIRLVRLR